MNNSINLVHVIEFNIIHMYRSIDKNREDLVLIVHKGISIIILGYTKQNVETQHCSSVVCFNIREDEGRECEERGKEITVTLD